MNNRIIAALLCATALAVPAAAAAGPRHGKGAEKHEVKDKVKTPKGKKVTFVFKGVFTASATVNVLSGNAHVRKGGFVGRDVSFDFTGAKVVVADTNADATADLSDVKEGDRVLVQARAAKGTVYSVPAEGEPAEAAMAARKLVDKTNAPVDAEDTPGE